MGQKGPQGSKGTNFQLQTAKSWGSHSHHGDCSENIVTHTGKQQGEQILKVLITRKKNFRALGGDRRSEDAWGALVHYIQTADHYVVLLKLI